MKPNASALPPAAPATRLRRSPALPVVPPRDVSAEPLEGRLGLRLAASLDEQADALPHDLSERLRVAREHALARARRRPAALPVAVAVPDHAHQGRSVVIDSPMPWWQRLAGALPLALVAGGLVFILGHQEPERLEVATEIDSLLLADELPPQAYSDPGFTEFLKRRSGS